MEDNKRKIKNYEKEGVIYTPSERAQNAEAVKKGTNGKQTVKRTVKRRKKKSQFALLMAVMIFTGVSVIIISFILVFNSFLSGSEYTGKSTIKPQQTQRVTSGPVITESTKTETVAVIRAAANKQLTLYDLENEKEYILMVEGGTLIKNKYGEALVFAELKVGDIVEINFENSSNGLTSVVHSTKAVELSKITNAKLDIQNGTITVGNDHYYYTDMTNVTYNGQKHSIMDIKSIDILTLKGYKNTIWDIEINKSHGYLRVLNKERVVNGTLEINTSTYMALSDSEEFDLLEGTHRIVVKGNNIEPFIKEVSIMEGETILLDLSEVRLTAGMLTINISEPNATISLNGIERLANEPIYLPFGEYELTVTKNGFKTYEETFFFEEAEKEINAVLDKEQQFKVIDIATNPEGARCFIDDVYYGYTPVSVSLEYGSRTIRFVKEGHIETTFTLNVSETTKLPIITLQSTDNFIPSQ